MNHDSPAGKLARLRRLSALAERRLRQRQRDWLAERQRLDGLSTRRGELSRFTKEYQRPAREGEATLPSLLASRRGFVAGLAREAERLGVEIDRQRQRVMASRRAIARPAAEWVALDRACRRQEADRRIDERRAEQKQTDEVAARRPVMTVSRD